MGNKCFQTWRKESEPQNASDQGPLPSLTSYSALEKLPLWFTSFIGKRRAKQHLPFQFCRLLHEDDNKQWDDMYFCIDTSNFYSLTFILMTHNVIPIDGWPTGLLRGLFALTHLTEHSQRQGVGVNSHLYFYLRKHIIEWCN